MSLDDGTARPWPSVAVEEAAGVQLMTGFTAARPALWHDDIGGDA